MRWEYRTLKVVDASWFQTTINEAAVVEQLNALGAEGWELVSSFSATQNGTSMFYVFLLKRPVGP